MIINKNPLTNKIVGSALLLFLLVLLLLLISNPIAALADSSITEPIVVVAGAGPAGLLFAQRYLELTEAAEPKQRVHIYESKTPDDDDRQQQSLYYYVDSAFGFGIAERARAALRKTTHGEELIRAVGKIAAKTPSGLWLVNRADLCHVLTQHLLEGNKNNNERLKITYGAQVCGIHEDDSTGQLFAEIQQRNEDGDTKTTLVPYSLLVAADGTHSRIRKDLVQKGKLRQKRYLRPAQWKALQLPPQPNLAPGSFLPFPPPAITEYGAIIPRHPDRFVALLFWRTNKDQTNPFNAKTPNELKQAMQRTFPNITNFPPDDELNLFLQNAPGSEYHMKLNHHAVKDLRVALLGDAASGVYSKLGQGCAFALWSANLLAETLLHSQPQEAQPLQTFSVQSKRQGHSLADLNLLAHLDYSPWLARLKLYNFFEMSKIVNDPEWSYADLLRKYRWQVAVAKIHWRFTRKFVSE